MRGRAGGRGAAGGFGPFLLETPEATTRVSVNPRNEAMFNLSRNDKLTLEIMLILVCIGLACLLGVMQGYKMVILYLFFPPVVLGAFFLGRYPGGVLALFCAISASVVTAVDWAGFSHAPSPLILALALTVWAAVLGLTAMLTGTLSDDRARKAQELHEAYVGVIEVLSQYLQSAHPQIKARSIEVAELSQEMAVAMRLSPRQIDDIRVAALLFDMGNIEVTTRVIRRAVGMFEEQANPAPGNTFRGSDLMLSLGSVLSGAIPLLLDQEQEGIGRASATGPKETEIIPIGAKIIRLARSYVTLTQRTLGTTDADPDEVFEQLRNDAATRDDRDLIDVLEQIVAHAGEVHLRHPVELV